MKKLILFGILVLAMAAIGCGGETEQTTATQPEQASTPVDIFAIQTKWLTDFALGSELGTGGAVAASKNTFAPGETIHYSMKVGEAPPASAAKVVWLGPSDAKLGEEMKGITTGQTVLSFQAPDSAAWAPGAYRAELWVVDEKVNSQSFTIEEAAVETKAAPASKAKAKTKR